MASLWAEIFGFLVTTAMLQGIPWEDRWGNLAAAVGWLIVVAWAARLMRRGGGPALIGLSGLLVGAGNVLERLAILRGWGWGIVIGMGLDLASLALGIAGVMLMFRHRVPR